MRCTRVLADAACFPSFKCFITKFFITRFSQSSMEVFASVFASATASIVFGIALPAFKVTRFPEYEKKSTRKNEKISDKRPKRG